MRDLQKMRAAIEAELRASLSNEVGTRFVSLVDGDDLPDEGECELEFRWSDGKVEVFEELVPDDESEPVLRRMATFGVRVELLGVRTHAEAE